MVEGNNAILQLLDVLEIHYKDNSQNTDKARTFCAVSLRKSANTVIETDGKTIKLEDRSLTFFPANTPYFRKSLYDDMIVIHFNSSVPLFDSIFTMNNFDYDLMLKRFEKALSVWKGYDTDKYYRASAVLYEIISVLYKNTNYNHYSKQMKSAMNYVKVNIKNPSLSVDDIAKNLNVCQTTLRNLFMREMGISPKQYIIKTRMTEAASMINSGYWSITQIAANIGYYDQKNFSTAFKKYFGYSPSKQKYNFYSEFD